MSWSTKFFAPRHVRSGPRSARLAVSMAKTKTIERLGISALARLRHRPRGASRCGNATATAARSRATGPRPNRRTAASAGISASATPPSTIAAGIISKGLTAEEAALREANERQGADAFASAGHYGWGGPGDGSRSRDEMRALDVLELEAGAGVRGDQGRLSPPRQGQSSGREARRHARPPGASR